jgi:putative membrane protein
MDITAFLSRSVAALNTLATIFLLIGFFRIRRGDKVGHGKAMGTAVIISALFLAVYLASKVHLWFVYGKSNILYIGSYKALYYWILIPHIILAIIVTPFVIRAVWLARSNRFEEHKRLVRWVFPVWLYVSITGVIVWAFMEFSGSIAAVGASVR